MANFHFFHPLDNVAGNATLSTSLTVDANYPLVNATDLTYAKIASPARVSELTGSFVFDFGSAQRMDAIVLWHNFDAGLACSWQMNAANSWGAPTVSASLTIPSKRADDYTVKAYKDLTGVSGYSTGGFRYARLNVTGTNSFGLGFKVLVFSRIRQTTRNFNYGVNWTETQANIEMSTDGLIPWAYSLGMGPRMFSADMLALDTDVTLLREWFRACRGSVSPTVIVPDPAVNDAWLVRWASGGVSVKAPGVTVPKFEVNQFSPSLFRTGLSFEEITAGDPEWS